MSASSTLEPGDRPRADEIERLIDQERYSEVIAALEPHRKRGDLSLELALYHLYASMKVDSFAAHEERIDSFVATRAFSEKEKEILRRVFVVGFEEAKRENRADRVRLCQRLARRLVLDQPLAEVWRSQKRLPPGEGPKRAPGDSAAAVRDPRPEQRRLAERKPRIVRLAVCFLAAAGIALVYPRAEKARGPSQPARLAAVEEGPEAFVEKARALSGERPHEAGGRAEPFLERQAAPPAKAAEAPAMRKERATKPAPAKLAEAAPAGGTMAKKARGLVRVRVPVPLRLEPRFGAAQSATLESGAIVTVVDQRGDWLEVRTDVGPGSGYVRREFTFPVTGEDQSGAAAR
ncbi:MAG TPA: hypothetical protein VNL14_11425 [Candidatus Acidoferrales bacterium]|nr:hypothetical protein [Candidatus Acidoferrales bacterium]